MENVMHMLSKTIIAASLVLGFGISAASADVLAVKSRTSPFSVPTSSTPVPLDDNGNTVLNFEANKKGFVVITYNAECAATGDAGSWVGLEILVDGKATNPKQGPGDFAFCSATGNEEIYTAVSRQAYIKIKAGPHSVQVRALRTAGTDSGRLDDSSIVVMD